MEQEWFEFGAYSLECSESILIFIDIICNYELCPPTTENCYAMSAQEREARGIGSLPGSLGEAIKEAENSELLHEALGEKMHAKLIENKKIEVDRYRKQVTNWEIEQYLPVL